MASTDTKVRAPRKTVPAQKGHQEEIPVVPVRRMPTDSRALRFTKSTVTVEEWLIQAGNLKDGKVNTNIYPDADYQRGRVPYTNAKKKQQLTHILAGGSFPPLSVWYQDGKLVEIVNGVQRTHSYAMCAQAAIMLEMDAEATVSPVMETAISTVLDDEVDPITWAELRLMPIELEVLPDSATYAQRKDLYIKRGTMEIAQDAGHLADLAQSELLEIIRGWGIDLATSRAISDAKAGAGKVKTEVDGIKSLLPIEAVHAYVNGTPAVSKAKLASEADNAELLKKIAEQAANGQKHLGKDMVILFNGLRLELHAKCDDFWPALKRENSTVFDAIAAALGYARVALEKNQDTVDGNLSALRKLLTSEAADPLNIKDMAGNMMSFYDNPKSNGAKKRDLMFHGFKSFLVSGPHDEVTPIRWDLAAKEAGITE